MDFLKVNDRDIVLIISYEDMIKYHGRFNIGGVAIAFKVLELAFSKLSPGAVPTREKINFVSGMGMAGPGLIDGVEMVTRAWTRGRMIVDDQLNTRLPALDLPDGGKYYYEMEYEGKRIAMALKDGLIPEEFMVLTRKVKAATINPEEACRLQVLKEDIAAALMSREPEELFNWVII
ncbi:MAG: FmdE family protein [Syntrophomonas sp.]